MTTRKPLSELEDNRQNVTEAFDRLLSEVSELNKQNLLLKLELSSNPLTNGLSTIGAVKVLNTEIYKMQAELRSLNNQLMVLQARLNKSREVFLGELLKELDRPK